MFFQINTENKIGFKQLSSADLGQSSTSHQTHIGLYDDMLSFMPDTHIEKAAILMYCDYCEILSCEYGKINRKDGSKNAPKVQSGNKSKNTIVRKIREFAKEKTNCNWYLLWFGTDSNELVFWLISSDSSDYEYVSSFLNEYKVYDLNEPSLKAIISFLESKINGVSQNILKDLEIACQVGDFKRRFKKLDLEKASAKCKEIGRNGEELIDEYLNREKHKGRITNYIWENKSREVGKPFDFVIDPSLSTECFVDVKSTKFDFSQEVIFSEQEISFITELKDDNRYLAFRVFDIYEESKKLSICGKCIKYLSRIDGRIEAFHRELNKHKAYSKALSIAVRPNICFMSIKNPIIL